jgi:Domain of unknown function (DUF4148)
MNRKVLFALMFAASSVYANDIDPNGFDKQPFASTKSRVDVAAEGAQAMRLGEIPRGEADAPTAPTHSTKVRSEVKADVVLARARGELIYGEAGASFAGHGWKRHQ